ncbi:MAG TPA: response regulator transcription factor [Chloroflexota bacterium]
MLAAPPELIHDLAGSTLLLVEDEADLAEPTAAAFVASGCTVWHAESGADARAMLKSAVPDAILLDLSLPDVDGLVLCPRLHAEAADTPIIVCSAETDRRDRLLAFRLGAEDVVSKPYDLDELQARVAVALRRRSRTTSPTARQDSAVASGGLGALSIDLPGWRVRVAEREVHLTPTEFKLLSYMASCAGAIVSRDQLADDVWGTRTMSASRTIDAYIRRLRNKLRGPGTPQFLHVRGLGYQLVRDP